MSARELEIFLARIYTDAAARAAFKANPRGEALRAGLSEQESSSLESMDWSGLELAAQSYASKRRLKAKRSRARSLLLRLRLFFVNLPKTIRSLF